MLKAKLYKRYSTKTHEVEFIELTFYGDDYFSGLLNRIKDNITYAKYDKYNKLMQCEENRLAPLLYQIEQKQKEVNEIKKHKVWKLSSNKKNSVLQLEDDIHNLESCANEVKEQIDMYDKERFFNAITLEVRYEDLLKVLGFKTKSTVVESSLTKVVPKQVTQIFEYPNQDFDNLLFEIEKYNNKVNKFAKDFFDRPPVRLKIDTPFNNLQQDR